MDENVIRLIEPGFLKACWHGKYHYLEPWIGCEHDCLYCYGRSRQVVNDSLVYYQTVFNRPLTLYTPEILLEKMRQAIKKNKVKILKLSRYTDIFIPKFVHNGFTYALLNELCQSSVKRIIMTTKGIPNEEIVSLIKKYSDKFSYNAVIKPQCEYLLEPNTPTNEEKLKILSELDQAGLQCTVHMDPLVFGLSMTKEDWYNFLKQIQSFGLNRIIFSYLNKWR